MFVKNILLEMLKVRKMGGGGNVGRLPLAVVVATLVLFTEINALADYMSWNGGAGAYSDASKWTTVVSETQTGRWVQAGTDDEFTGNTDISGTTLHVMGVNLKLNARLYIGNTNAPAEMVISNATVTQAAGANVWLGDPAQGSNPNCSGTLTIHDGGVFNAYIGSSNFFRVGQNSPGTINVNRGGAFNMQTGTMLVGRNGLGTINVDGGTFTAASGTNLYLGGYLDGETSSAVVSITNGGTFSSAGTVHLAPKRPLTLHVDATSSFSASTLSIGGDVTWDLRPGSQFNINSIAVSNSQVFTLSGTSSIMDKIELGTSAGAGTMVIENATVKISGKNVNESFFIGNHANGKGALTINAGGVLDNRCGNTGNWLRIGNNGEGVVEVNPGGKILTSQNTLVGRNYDGSMTIDGGTFESTDVVNVAYAAGKGTLRVLNGAKFSTQNLVVAVGNSGGPGIVTVSNGSELTINSTDMTGSTRIGSIKTGVVSIQSGSTFNSTGNSLWLGGSTGSNGTLEILESTANLKTVQVGNSGVGTVVIRNSDVDVSDRICIGQDFTGNLFIVGGGSDITCKIFQSKPHGETLTRFQIGPDGVSTIRAKTASYSIGGSNTLGGRFTAEMASGFTTFDKDHYVLIEAETAFTLQTGQYAGYLIESELWTLAQSGKQATAALKSDSRLGTLDMAAHNGAFEVTTPISSGFWEITNPRADDVQFRLNVGGDSGYMDELASWLSGEKLTNESGDSLMSYLPMDATADGNALTLTFRTPEEANFLAFDLAPFNTFYGLTGADAMALSGAQSWGLVPEPCAWALLILGALCLPAVGFRCRAGRR